ncbi:MAG TPA: hypothetical protein VGX23_22540 [Actinocrinis sp.]|nr:hypothetical protein [Actinocrinis sp.]
MFGHSTLQTVVINQDEAHGLAHAEYTCRAMQGRSDVVLPFTVIYRNLRTDSVVSCASVALAIRDKQGFAIGTHTSRLSEVPPLGVGVWSGAVTASNGKPFIAELEVREVERRPTGTGPDRFVPFPVERARFNGKHDGHWNAAGEIANPYPKPLDDMRVIVLARDGDGLLTDSAETYVGPVAANRSVPFEVDSWGPGKPARYEVITLPIVYHGGWEGLVAGRLG